MKKYCMSCGNPTEYSLKIPNYCSNCGLSFNKSQPNKQNIKPKLEKPVESIDFEDDDDFEEIDSSVIVPKINRLVLEDDGVNAPKPKGVKIKDLVGTGSTGPNKKEKNKKNQKSASRKKILEDFASEAGSIRPKNK